MVSTRSGRSTLNADVHANEVTSTATTPSRVVQAGQELQSSEQKDTTQVLDKMPSGTISSLDLRPSGDHVSSPRKKAGASLNGSMKERRISDVVVEPDVQKTKSLSRKASAREIIGLAQIPLSDEEEEQEQTREGGIPSSHEKETAVETASEAADGMGASRRRRPASSGSGRAVLTMSTLLLSLGAATWMVLCNGPALPFNLLPEDSPILSAAAPTCVRISSESEAAWYQMQYAWDSVVRSAEDTAVYYNNRFKSLMSPKPAAPPTFNPVYEELPLTFRTWMTESTFKQLLPPGWDELVPTFYGLAKKQAVEKAKAASVVLACNHFSVCTAAANAVKASVSRSVPGCYMHINLGTYIRNASLLETDLGHQLGGCPNSVIVVQEAERASPEVLAVLAKATAENGHAALDDHKVPASGAIMMLMYETGTAPPADGFADNMQYGEMIKDQVQGDLEALIGDFNSGVLAENFRQQIDWVAPLR